MARTHPKGVVKHLERTLAAPPAMFPGAPGAVAAEGGDKNNLLSLRTAFASFVLPVQTGTRPCVLPEEKRSYVVLHWMEEGRVQFPIHIL